MAQAAAQRVAEDLNALLDHLAMMEQVAMASWQAPWVLLGILGLMTILTAHLLHRAQVWRSRAFESADIIEQMQDDAKQLCSDIDLTTDERDKAEGALKLARSALKDARSFNSSLLTELEAVEVANAGLATRLTAEEHHKVALQGALDRRNAYRRRKAGNAVAKPVPDVIAL